jgi:hypothetical protein
MRTSILSILIISWIFAAGRHAYVPEHLGTRFPKSDTIFIEREKTKDYYCKTYIEKNRESILYEQLIDFSMENWEKERYSYGLKELKKNRLHVLKKYKLTGLPREWLPLYRYKGKYYVYSPGEEGTEGRRFLTDSTMVYWFGDEVSPQPILSAQAVNLQTWYLNIRSYFEQRRNSKLIIHIIDPKTKIAVWEDDNQPDADRYELYIPKESVKDFDMIVSRCDNIKTAPFGSFDQIDYKALLAGH